MSMRSHWIWWRFQWCTNWRRFDWWSLRWRLTILTLFWLLLSTEVFFNKIILFFVINPIALFLMLFLIRLCINCRFILFSLPTSILLFFSLLSPSPPTASATILFILHVLFNPLLIFLSSIHCIGTLPNPWSTKTCVLNIWTSWSCCSSWSNRNSNRNVSCIPNSL